MFQYIMNLRNIKSKELVKILHKFVIDIKRQSGTHIIMKKDEKTVVVPIHHEIMPIGTLKSIEKQSEVNFRDL